MREENVDFRHRQKLDLRIQDDRYKKVCDDCAIVSKATFVMLGLFSSLKYVIVDQNDGNGV